MIGANRWLKAVALSIAIIVVAGAVFYAAALH
jgi:hypothetical protein